MEETMRNQRIPETDSIAELAAFWDTHDLTRFEDQLEEVAEPIFVRGKPSIVEISLKPSEVQTLKRIAQSEGIEEASLLRNWIVEKLSGASSPARLQKRGTRRG
jgi:CopG antitoxin of type II toxin-antitoxin system